MTMRTHLGALVLGGALLACGDIAADLPAGTVDPNTYATPEGAEQMARGARYQYQVGLLTFMLDVGMMTDELVDSDSANRVPAVYSRISVLDQRHLPDETMDRTPLGEIISGVESYAALQKVRAAASLAERALVAYSDTPQPAFRAEMLTYEALAEIMLGDMYCSGVPLSAIQFGGDYIYRPGSTTAQVYEHAVVLLDSALVLAVSNPTIVSLVGIAKGRALLALGRYDEAAAAVHDVPTGFKHELLGVRLTGKTSGNPDGFSWPIAWIADRKGGNGLTFGSAPDPRIVKLNNNLGQPTTANTRTHVQVASYVEARLIEAEAALQAGDIPVWTQTLNALRAGHSPVIPPLTVDSTTTASATLRQDVMFRERAFWLFFTGHRQGDLRRLIRHYGRTVTATYPTGPSRGAFEAYDDYVDVPIPSTERYNPHVTGCISRGA